VTFVGFGCVSSPRRTSRLLPSKICSNTWLPLSVATQKYHGPSMLTGIVTARLRV